jgi:hypothetical protein
MRAKSYSGLQLFPPSVEPWLYCRTLLGANLDQLQVPLQRWPAGLRNLVAPVIHDAIFQSAVEKYVAGGLEPTPMDKRSKQSQPAISSSYRRWDFLCCCEALGAQKESEGIHEIPSLRS